MKVYLEISGACNANCPWCITGAGGQARGVMMNLNDFRRCIDRLEDLGAVRAGERVNLYNWGEPTLNKHLDAMLAYLGEKGVLGTISTNSINGYLPSKEACCGLGDLAFSVSGMIDASEEKMHGVPATRVLRNMDAMLNHLRSFGWKEHAHMAFHIYQHNLAEVTAAYDWCAERRIGFFPSFAFLNNFNMTQSFLEGTLSRELLIKASKELILYYVDDLLASMPKGWTCSFRDQQLVIDSSCDVLTCCALPRDQEECILGSIFDLDLEDIKERKAERRICAGCEASGAAWWFAHPQGQEVFQDAIYEHRLRLRLRQVVPKPLRRLLGYMLAE